jgi:beta-N-acetylhexosaminidase
MKFNNLLALSVCCLLSCGSKEKDSGVQRLQPRTAGQSAQQSVQEPRVDSSAAPKIGSYSIQDFYSKNAALDKKVEEIFAALSVDERAAQMIMPAVANNSYGMPFADFKKYYEQKKVGGAIFLHGTVAGFASNNQAIVASAAANKILRPLITADAEPSLMHYKFSDVAKMTATASLRTELQIRTEARKIIKELKKAGVNTNFAPVADINTNKAIIGNRSFGSSMDTIVSRCSYFMREHHNDNIATVIKHFPGHGNVKGDTHKSLVSIYGALSEVPTFKALIDRGALGVMVGHLAVQKNDQWSTSGQPATLSRNIVSKLLRDSLQFKGIVYTDAMNMGAVAKIGNASYKALCAGVDIVLMPLDINTVHKQVVAQLNSKGQYSDQFTASIKRIIRMKICLGLVP